VLSSDRERINASSGVQLTRCKSVWAADQLRRALLRSLLPSNMSAAAAASSSVPASSGVVAIPAVAPLDADVPVIRALSEAVVNRIAAGQYHRMHACWEPKHPHRGC
jgi:hypothetical protein